MTAQRQQNTLVQKSENEEEFREEFKNVKREGKSIGDYSSVSTPINL